MSTSTHHVLVLSCPPLHPPRAAHLAQLLRSPASRNALHSSTTMNASPTRDIHWISSPSGSSRPLRAPAPRYICLTTLRTRQLRAYTHSDPACAFTSYDTPNTLARLRRGICPARHSREHDRPFDECAPCACDTCVLPLRRSSLPDSSRSSAALSFVLSYRPCIPPDRPSALRTRLASVCTRALSSHFLSHTHPWPCRLSFSPR